MSSEEEVEETTTEEEEDVEEGTSEDAADTSEEEEQPAKPAQKADAKNGAKKKHSVSSKSHVAEGRAKTEVKKGKDMVFECDMASGAVTAGSTVDVHVVIKNESPKSVKSIQAWIRVFKGKPKGKGKKVKRPKPKKMEETEQEYFQGARFPLPPHVGYEGNVSFPLPKKLEPTSETTEYELVLNFDVSAALGWSHIHAYLPLIITG